MMSNLTALGVAIFASYVMLNVSVDGSADITGIIASVVSCMATNRVSLANPLS